MQITNNLIEEDIIIEGIKGTIIKDITIKGTIVADIIMDIIIIGTTIKATIDYTLLKYYLFKYL